MFLFFFVLKTRLVIYYKNNVFVVLYELHPCQKVSYLQSHFLLLLLLFLEYTMIWYIMVREINLMKMETITTCSLLLRTCVIHPSIRESIRFDSIQHFVPWVKKNSVLPLVLLPLPSTINMHETNNEILVRWDIVGAVIIV